MMIPLLVAAAFALQDPTPEELVARRDEKLASPFLAKAAWRTDYDRAREEAKKSGRIIFAYFTRSYSS